MNKETYNKAIVISNRLSQLQKVKEELEDTRSHYLTYAEKASSLGSHNSLCHGYIMENISAILDKHDKMIRQEIDGEIAALDKEIEEL